MWVFFLASVILCVNSFPQHTNRDSNAVVENRNYNQNSDYGGTESAAMPPSSEDVLALTSAQDPPTADFGDDIPKPGFSCELHPTLLLNQ